MREVKKKRPARFSCGPGSMRVWLLDVREPRVGNDDLPAADPLAPPVHSDQGADPQLREERLVTGVELDANLLRGRLAAGDFAEGDEDDRPVLQLLHLREFQSDRLALELRVAGGVG